MGAVCSKSDSTWQQQLKKQPPEQVSLAPFTADQASVALTPCAEACAKGCAGVAVQMHFASFGADACEQTVDSGGRQLHVQAQAEPAANVAGSVASGAAAQAAALTAEGSAQAAIPGLLRGGVGVAHGVGLDVPASHCMRVWAAYMDLRSLCGVACASWTAYAGATWLMRGTLDTNIGDDVDDEDWHPQWGDEPAPLAHFGLGSQS